MVKWFVTDEVERILESLIGYWKSCPGTSLEGLKIFTETLSHSSHCVDS